MRSRILKTFFGAVGLTFVALQLVPYGWNHSNPPVNTEPEWDSPRTRELAVRACFDCHSNEVHWPWYAYVAPASWLVVYDVTEGRAELNFSEMQRPQEEAGEAAETVAEGEMPPTVYLPLHPKAWLTPEERTALIAGLQATLGGEGHSVRAGGEAHRDGQ